MPEVRPLTTQNAAASRGLFPSPRVTNLAALGRDERATAATTGGPLRPLRLTPSLDRAAFGGRGAAVPGAAPTSRRGDYFELAPQTPDALGGDRRPAAAAPRDEPRLEFDAAGPSGWPLTRPPISRTATFELGAWSTAPTPGSVTGPYTPASPTDLEPIKLDLEAGVGQPELLGMRRAAPRLSTNLQQRSPVPFALLALMILSKLPVLYGGQLAGRGLREGGSALGAGIGTIAAGTVLNGAAVAVGIRDTVNMKTTLKRNPRLQYLGKRSTIYSLSALALCAPIALAAITVSFNHAVQTGNSTRANWLRLPANLVAAGHVFAAGPLYTVMQMHRGWTPPKLNLLAVNAAGIWCATTQLQFGVSGSATHLPPAALVPVQYVPYLAGLLLWCQMFSWANYLSLQAGLTDATRLPWETARGR